MLGDASDASTCIAVYFHVAELAISEAVSENKFDIYALACIASVRVWTFLSRLYVVSGSVGSKLAICVQSASKIP